MGRWMLFFGIITIAANILMAAYNGGGGAAQTTTTAAVAIADNHVHVSTTAGFLSPAGYAAFGNGEFFEYTGLTATQFTGVTRGVEDPQTGKSVAPIALDSGTAVMTIDVLAMNQLMGYDVASASSSKGSAYALQSSGSVLKNIGKYITWDYPILDGQLIYIRYIGAAFTMAFLLMLGLAMLNLAWGIFS